MGLSETKNIKISSFNFFTKSWAFIPNGPTANPNFIGPGLRATSPDNRTRASCLKDAFSQNVTLCDLT